MSSTAIIRFNRKGFDIWLKTGGFGKQSLKEYKRFHSEKREEVMSGLSDSLRDLRESEGVKDAVLFLSLSELVPSFCRLPKMKKEDLLKAVPFELEGSLPLSPDEYIHRATYLGGTDEEQEVFCLSLLKGRYEEVLGLFSNAGVPVRSIRVWSMYLVTEGTRRIVAGGKDDFLFIFKEGEDWVVSSVREGRLSELKEVRRADSLPMVIGRLKGQRQLDIYVWGKDVYQVEGIDCITLSLDEKDLLAKVDLSRWDDFDFSEGRSNLLEQRYRMLIGGLAVTSVLLYLCSLFLPYLFDRAVLNSIERDIAAVQREAADLIEKDKEREKLKKMVLEMDRIKGRSMLPVLTLRELTERIPPGSWLSNYQFKEGEVEISGFSDQASSIIEPIEESPLLDDVHFSSPVISRGDKERFVIKMEVRQ